MRERYPEAGGMRVGGHPRYPKPALLRKLVLQNSGWSVVAAVLLFASAGTLQWWAAWAFVTEMALLGFGVGLWLSRRNPKSLRNRLATIARPRQSAADVMFMSATFLLWALWLAVMGLDAGRYRWSAVPAWCQLMGGLLLVLYMYVTELVLRENEFAVPALAIESDHRIVTTGPYRFVRHPIYASAVLFYLGGSMLLGSVWGLVLVPVIVALLSLRAITEERLLSAESQSYSNYAMRVRYRFIPLVW